eukprot:scaffold23007_cov60-Phaeocystis_antarctica.AAC.2
MVRQEWPTSFTPLASTGRDPYTGRAFNTHSNARLLASTGSTVQELVESLGEVTTLGLSKGRSLVGPTKGQALTPPPPASAILTPGRVAGVAFLAAGMVAGTAACAL